MQLMSANRSIMLALAASVMVLVLTMAPLLNRSVDSGDTDQSGDLADVPVRPLPEVLADISLPADANSITRMLGLLPGTVSGRERFNRPVERAVDTFSIAYGEGQNRTGQTPLRLTIQNVQTSHPHLSIPSAATVVVTQAQQADTYSIPHETGRDGEIYWFYAPTLRPLLVAGSDSSPWLYTTSAPNRKQLEAFLLAFFQTVMGEAPACMLKEEPQCYGL